MDTSKMSDEELNKVMKNFAGKIDLYAVGLSVGAEEAEEIKVDSAAFDYALDMHNRVKNHGKDWTAYKNLLRNKGETTAIGQFPVWNPSTPPKASEGHIEKKFTQLVNRLVNHPKYTPAIGQDLGIIISSTAMSAAEKTELKPAIKIHLDAGLPVIEWTKGNADGIEIHKKANAAEDFKFLDIDHRPNFTDSSPLPAPGKSEVWIYRAIYRLDDKRVGIWSDDVSVTVTGK
jgi:hypothetical protein